MGSINIQKERGRERERDRERERGGGKIWERCLSTSTVYAAHGVVCEDLPCHYLILLKPSVVEQTPFPPSSQHSLIELLK